MRITLPCLVLASALAAVLGAESVPLRDLDSAELPNEYKNMADVRLTTQHARDGHVALAFRPAGRGWVTRYALWHNWTWYDRVAFRMFNGNDAPVTFTWEVRTRHARRANIKVTVQPGANDVVLKFADFTNAAEKPLSLYDVGQWVMFFDGELAKPLYLSEYRLIRGNIQLPAPTQADLKNCWTAENATVKSEKAEGDPLPVHWAACTFAAGKDGVVWVTLRPDTRDFNTFSLPENWLGYESLTFIVDNPLPEPVRFEILFEDLIARGCRDTRFRPEQSAVVATAAQPGQGSFNVPLGMLKTLDGRRWLDLSQMYRIGFRVKNPAAELRLRFSDLRVRTTSESAGVLVPLDDARKCVRCGNRLDDANCVACPFCGKFYNETAVVTKPVDGAIRIEPVKDGFVMASSGGGGPTVDQTSGTGSTLSVCHYDVSFWEGRAFLRFDPSAVPAGARIRKAELRITREKPGYGKAWLCPVRLFVAPEGKDDFDEATLSWITQPPIGEFASQGGLYYYWTDAMALDVTRFLNARLAKSRKPFTLIVRAFEAEPCKENAHLFGHHLPFFSREAKDASQRPHLYIELE